MVNTSSTLKLSIVVTILSFICGCGGSETQKKIQFPNDEYTIPEPVIEYSDVTVTSLKALADFPIGVAVPAGNAGNSLMSSPDRQDLVTQHFSQLTAENIMKMDAMHPSENVFNFVDADELLSFAANNELTVHGHVLVWHSQIPDWIRNFDGDSTAWGAMMENHITQIATRYSGQLASWDVVNEAFNDDGSYRGSADGDDSVWFEHIGKSFIEKAFIAARAADANVDLYYNDYNISWDADKLDGIVAMAADFQARDIPINGIGFQMHISATGPDKATFAKQLKKVVDLGLKVKISELDMRMNEDDTSSTLTPEIAELQKKRYFDLVSTYLETVPAAQRGGVSVWGLIDDDSWIIDLYGLADWPLLFNDDYTAKPALQGFADALKTEEVDTPDIPDATEPNENEILVNVNFEAGLDAWEGRGDATITLETTEIHSGINSVLVADRNDGWHGIQQNITGLLTAGQTYTISAWVKLANADSSDLKLSLQLTQDGSPNWLTPATATAIKGDWVLISGSYTHTLTGTEDELLFYVEADDATVNFYVDDASIVPEVVVPEEPAVVEILANADLEAGLDSWEGRGDASITLETTEIHGGINSVLVADRTAGWHGIQQNITSLLTPGQTYTISAWVKLANAASSDIKLSLQLTQDGSPNWLTPAVATATNGDWVKISGTYTHTLTSTEDDLLFYVEADDATVNFYVDDTSITLAE